MVTDSDRVLQIVTIQIVTFCYNGSLSNNYYNNPSVPNISKAKSKVKLRFVNSLPKVNVTWNIFIYFVALHNSLTTELIFRYSACREEDSSSLLILMTTWKKT